MFRFAVLIAVSIVLSACATSSAPTKKEFLTGVPAETLKADDIFDGLARKISLKKKVKGMPNKSTEAVNKDAEVTITTKTSIEFAPQTEPLIVARARERVAEKAFQLKWSDAQKQAEHKKSVDAGMKKNAQGQCFETRVTTSDFAPVGGITPEQLNFKYWHVNLQQGEKSFPITLDKNPVCLITTRRTAYSNSSYVSTDKTYDCISEACIKGKIDLTAPFKIVVDARYETGLIPVELEWKGTAK